MTKTAILGFGNPCRSDDAIGIYVIDALKTAFAEREDISVFDMGTGAFEVLFKLQGHQQIILIDGVINSGEPVGSMFKVPAAEVMRAPVDDPMVFLHSIKWDQALSYAKKILREAYPENIDVYLIAIENTKLDMQLSETVQQAGDQLIAIISKQFERATVAV